MGGGNGGMFRVGEWKILHAVLVWSKSSAHQLKESPDKKKKEYSDVGVKICCEVEKRRLRAWDNKRRAG